MCNEITFGVCNGCGDCNVEDCADMHPGTGEAVYVEQDDICNGECDDCTVCACNEEDGQPTWEQEWEDFGEEGCESIEYL